MKWKFNWLILIVFYVIKIIIALRVFFFFFGLDFD